jgi:hypothetical protein
MLFRNPLQAFSLDALDLDNDAILHRYRNFPKAQAAKGLTDVF